MVQLFLAGLDIWTKYASIYIYPAVTASFSSLSRPYSDSKCSSRTSLIRTVLPVSLLSCKNQAPKAGAHRGNGDTVILSDTPFKSKVYWKLLPTVLHCTNEKTKQAALQALLEPMGFLLFLFFPQPPNLGQRQSVVPVAGRSQLHPWLES